ncbi:MAG TPA: glucose 1-dehydrogenase [Chloroflexota bacterium]|nr:glucose 1-dehydrogenase [Chloroflexota bacterium]
MQIDLTGRRAIVTGGGRGIGRALALGLARSGANLAIIYRQDGAAAESAVEEARRHGVRGLSVQADTADGSQARAAVGRVAAELGGVDILINNAGLLSRVPFLELAEDEWRRVLRTNLDGYFVVGQAVARQMVAAGTGGVIVNVTSVNQSVVGPNLTHYSVSKAGAFALTQQMAYELAPYGIRVNALAPGMIETDINRADLTDPAFRAGRLSRIPLGFVAEPADLVGALLYLVSDEARYVTGSCVIVDGGSSMLGPAGLYPGSLTPPPRWK